MKESYYVDKFTAPIFMNFINELKQYGEILSDQRVIEEILRSFIGKFEVVVTAIEESKDINQMHIYEMTSSLVEHESRMRKYENSSLEIAFKSQLCVSGKRGKGMFGNTGIRGRKSKQRERKDYS